MKGSTSSASSWRPAMLRSSASASRWTCGGRCRVAGGHRVEGRADRDDPRGERDLAGDQTGRVAAAVDALVVVEDRVGDRAVAVELADERRAVLRVAADHLPVGVGQLLGVQDPVRPGELADVVQQRRGLDDLPLLLVDSRARSPARARSARQRWRGGWSRRRAGPARPSASRARRAACSRGGSSGLRAVRRAPPSAAAPDQVMEDRPARATPHSSTSSAEVRVGDGQQGREHAGGEVARDQGDEGSRGTGVAASGRLRGRDVESRPREVHEDRHEETAKTSSPNVDAGDSFAPPEVRWTFPTIIRTIMPPASADRLRGGQVRRATATAAAGAAPSWRDRRGQTEADRGGGPEQAHREHHGAVREALRMPVAIAELEAVAAR